MVYVILFGAVIGALVSHHCGIVASSVGHEHEHKIELLQKVQIILNFWSSFFFPRKANNNTAMCK